MSNMRTTAFDAPPFESLPTREREEHSEFRIQPQSIPMASVDSDTTQSDIGSSQITSSQDVLSRKPPPQCSFDTGLLLHHVRNSMDYLANIPFLQRNTGLLLIALSQLFFALMHTYVKVYSNLDPPISTLEVRSVMYPSHANKQCLTFAPRLSFH